MMEMVMVLDWWLDLMIFDTFSSPNDSMKFSLPGLLGSTEGQPAAAPGSWAFPAQEDSF